MKSLISLAAFVALSIASVAGTGDNPIPIVGSGHVANAQPTDGDNDSPYNMPFKVQVVQRGDLVILSTIDPDTVSLTSIASLDDLTGESGGRGSNGAVNDTGTPGGTLVSAWQEQDGTNVSVTTKKGAGESTKEFVKRHKNTVAWMKDAFPPVVPTTR